MIEIRLNATTARCGIIGPQVHLRQQQAGALTKKRFSSDLGQLSTTPDATAGVLTRNKPLAHLTIRNV
jgi:hypothetical protein